MQLREDSRDEQRIGSRELTHWPTRLGRGMVRLARALAGTFSANAVLVVTAVVGGLLVLGLTGAGVAVYDAVAENDGLAAFDRPALMEAMSLRSPGLDRFLTGFTHLGGPAGMSIIASIVTALMVWRWRSRTPLVLMLTAVAGSLLITILGKASVSRVRPPLVDAVPPYEHSFSFPSGHALNSTVIAGLVAYLILRRLASALQRGLVVGLAVLWAVSIGLSRVFLGHHWLTDVMFGWVIGLAWLAVVITAHRLFLTVRRARPPAGHTTG